MSYHRFNNWAELINRDLAEKIRLGKVSKYKMDRECNCSLPSKVNGKCVYKGKCWSEYIIYKVKCSICDAIYIGNTQKTFKTRMDGHLSDLLRPFKNGQNQTHLLRTSNSTLTLLRHVQIYISIWRLK